ncbi:thioesterase family protein [Bradyrhizobium sp. LHD-71]|uniref:thioesterase family protein n=1 Tax=Bradyrhizobium sp. LHD-71 TaxID=3072141 RepID=UPI00281083D3|nr:thioesterase family protein [Bradyrhizobium sp. LHD-71]MDQ8732772.1 thioesterase family protein [Bradyrhizobium sp. LHD-71]
MDTVYRLEGSHVVTGPMAGGPWDPKMQHGSAPSALIVAVAETVPTAVPMRVARLTVDLMRPIPVAPLQIKTEVLREGRKIQLCSIDLIADGKLAVRGTVLKIRREPYELPGNVSDEPVALPPAASGHLAKGKITDNPFMACLTMRVVKGGFNEPGPGAVWFRVERSIIDGRSNSAAMRAAIAADFCNGASSVLDFRSWTFINGDLSVSLARDPVGDWILLDAETWLGPDGSGIACARLGDAQGYFGRAAQSILIEPRGR